MPERLWEWVEEEEAKERLKHIDRKTVDVINFIILKHETKVRVRLCHHRTIYRIICCYTKRIVHFYLWPECDWVYFGSHSLSISLQCLSETSHMALCASKSIYMRYEDALYSTVVSYNHSISAPKIRYEPRYSLLYLLIWKHRNMFTNVRCCVGGHACVCFEMEHKATGAYRTVCCS